MKRDTTSGYFIFSSTLNRMKKTLFFAMIALIFLFSSMGCKKYIVDRSSVTDSDIKNFIGAWSIDSANTTTQSKQLQYSWGEGLYHEYTTQIFDYDLNRSKYFSISERLNQPVYTVVDMKKINKNTYVLLIQRLSMENYGPDVHESGYVKFKFLKDNVLSIDDEEYGFFHFWKNGGKLYKISGPIR